MDYKIDFSSVTTVKMINLITNEVIAEWDCILDNSEKIVTPPDAVELEESTEIFQ